jgi:hypothetical protein
VWVLYEPTFRRNVPPPSSGRKIVELRKALVVSLCCSCCGSRGILKQPNGGKQYQNSVSSYFPPESNFEIFKHVASDTKCKRAEYGPSTRSKITSVKEEIHRFSTQYRARLHTSQQPHCTTRPHATETTSAHQISCVNRSDPAAELQGSYTATQQDQATLKLC